MIFSLIAMTGLEKCCITSAYLPWLCHSGERPVARGPLVFGLQREHGVNKILHFIFLYAKHYIYLARCKNQQLNIRVFKMKLQVMYRVHRQIALSNQEEETFLAD